MLAVCYIRMFIRHFKLSNLKVIICKESSRRIYTIYWVVSLDDIYLLDNYLSDNSSSPYREQILLVFRKKQTRTHKSVRKTTHNR